MRRKILLNIVPVLLSLFLNLLPNRVLSQERCLIVLDIQELNLKNKQLENSVQEMILNVNFLISHFNPENVIYIKASGKAMSLTSKGFSVVALPAPEFDSALNIVSKNTFTKIEGDAFTVPELISFLESKKTKEIVLVGLMAEECLFDTAIGGKERGFDIKIVPEGIVGTTSKKKDKAIVKLKAKGISFIPLTEIINVP